MTNIENYLDKIVSYMLRHSSDGFPYDNSVMSFNDYCINTFGLTDDEIDYVYRRYRYLMGWVIDNDRSGLNK